MIAIGQRHAAPINDGSDDVPARRKSRNKPGSDDVPARRKSRSEHGFDDVPARRKSRNKPGLTLLEVIVSLVLVSTIILVSITASANLMRGKTILTNAIDGRELAFQILDEVTAVDFADPDNDRVFGRESSETAANRTDFDDVDDYHGYSSSPPTHRDGTAIAGFTNWSFSVSVSRAEPARGGLHASLDDTAPLRLVTVTCTAPSGALTIESMLVSQVAGNVPANTSFDKWRRLTLTFPDKRQIDVTVPLRNQPYNSQTY